MNKKIYYMGLGKMGNAMVQALVEKQWEVVAFDVNADARAAVGEFGVRTVDSVPGFFNEETKAEEGKVFWLQIPHMFVDEVIAELLLHLNKGDIVVDAGNSRFTLAKERAEKLAAVGAHFVDTGVSGGVEGARNGACMMIGAEKEIFDAIEPLFVDMALPDGYQYLGGNGAGHFVKMVHNGIEYGMMQAIAEGFDIMDQSDFDLNLQDVTRIYQKESIVTSRLVGWLAQGFDVYGTDLEEVSGSVGANGEGLWTIETAHEMGMSVPAIESSLEERKQSQEKPSYRGKLLQTMRAMFGGHAKDTGLKA